MHWDHEPGRVFGTVRGVVQRDRYDFDAPDFGLLVGKIGSG
jgi:hypothetical protein